MEVLIVLVFAVVAIAWQQVVAHEERAKARFRLMEVPETPIAAVKDGARVRIKGRVSAREALRTSPISERECVGYHLTVELYQGDDDHEWRKVVDQDDFAPFVIADGTGEAVLHGPFELKLASLEASGGDLPWAVREVLARADVPREGFFGFDNHFRWIETVVLPGDEIIAVGRVSLEIDPAGRSPSRRDPPFLCYLRGRDEAVILANVEQAWTGST